MVGLEFGSPKSLKLKAAWSLLETANAGLFSQIIVIPIFKDHKIVVQVAGHGLNVIKLIPPLTITDTDCDWIESAFDDVIADSHKVPGSVWTLGKTLAGHAMKARAGGVGRRQFFEGWAECPGSFGISRGDSLRRGARGVRLRA